MGMPQSAQQPRFRDRHHFVVVILVLIAGAVVIVRSNSGWHIADQAPATAPSVELRLDPNIASAEELAALPGLGPAMAARIVAYRDKQLASGRNPAFADLSDLDHVEGVGKATLEAIGPWLQFGGKR